MTNVAQDSPREFLSTGLSNVYRSDVFQTILMYSNNTPSNLPVPLKLVNWSWSGIAFHTKRDDTNWILQNPMTYCSQVGDTFIHPQWTNYFDPANTIK
jgi:hypothetical protein